MDANYLILQELYNYADGVIYDSVTPPGNYTASELASIKTKSARKYSYNDTGRERCRNRNCKLYGVVNGSNNITLTAGNFSCSFRKMDIFYIVSKFEKLCGITKSKQRVFRSLSDNELNG